GVGVTDVSAWLWDCGHVATACSCRSDFNHDGNVSPLDLARLLKVLGLGHSSHSAGTLCP
ncbi:MAG TPA: hypothetical protein VMS88_05775, partial [Terriglobales bacterium]|nr:hypothetical protein [Terriglobales bacterium]